MMKAYSAAEKDARATTVNLKGLNVKQHEVFPAKLTVVGDSKVTR